MQCSYCLLFYLSLISGCRCHWNWWMKSANESWKSTKKLQPLSQPYSRRGKDRMTDVRWAFFWGLVYAVWGVAYNQCYIYITPFIPLKCAAHCLSAGSQMHFLTVICLLNFYCTLMFNSCTIETKMKSTHVTIPRWEFCTENNFRKARRKKWLRMRKCNVQ